MTTFKKKLFLVILLLTFYFSQTLSISKNSNNYNRANNKKSISHNMNHNNIVKSDSSRMTNNVSETNDTNLKSDNIDNVDSSNEDDDNQNINDAVNRNECDVDVDDDDGVIFWPKCCFDDEVFYLDRKSCGKASEVHLLRDPRIYSIR